MTYFQLYHKRMKSNLVDSFIAKLPSDFDWIGVYENCIVQIEDLIPYKLKNGTHLTSITYDTNDKIMYGFVLQGDSMHLDCRITNKPLIQCLKDVGII